MRTAPRRSGLRAPCKWRAAAERGRAAQVIFWCNLKGPHPTTPGPCDRSQFASEMQAAIFALELSGRVRAERPLSRILAAASASIRSSSYPTATRIYAAADAARGGLGRCPRRAPMQPIDSTPSGCDGRARRGLQSVASPLAPPLFATRQGCVPQPENKIKGKRFPAGARARAALARHGARRDEPPRPSLPFCFSFVEAKADPGAPLLPQQPSPRDRKLSSCERDGGLFRCEKEQSVLAPCPVSITSRLR
jgi:hypothetical protein